jgi:alkylation response protein AidB-like acyl-CoA dehydrogenase
MRALPLRVAPLLPGIASQAAWADDSRSIAPELIAALKKNPVMALSASPELGGLNGSILDIGRELEAVAGACASTAWCLWNHLATFHLFCGLLGPANADLLRSVTERGQWVCLPAGAGTAVRGTVKSDSVVLNGVATFGTGARYADHAGVSFVFEGEQSVRFALVDLNQAGVRIDPDWHAMSLRASATDTVHYRNVRVPLARVAPFPFRFRETLRDPAFAVIDARYREDWVGLCDIWLGWMAAGLAEAALAEACAGIQDRRAILGAKMVERPTIHLNFGQAGALIAAARAVVRDASRETDARIAAGRIPTEIDYLDQMAAGMTAARMCEEAMRLILRVLGGAGLRQGPAFERRYRDLLAMPLHINVHPDRVAEQYGRHRLGLPTENPF